MPGAPGLRPTPDRVRETLFNWLGQDLSGWLCLDLFAGSGALGLEALSRGAARVVAVERDRRVAETLRQTADALGADGYELHCSDARAFLARERRCFDAIFVDPPFSERRSQDLWTALAQRLRPAGRLYVEAPERVSPPAGWTLLRSDRAGQVHYHLLRRSEAERSPVDGSAGPSSAEPGGAPGAMETERRIRP